jgi:hypothetical protein
MRQMDQTAESEKSRVIKDILSLPNDIFHDMWERVTGQLEFWHTVQVSISLALVALGFVTAICVALQTERNSKYLKPIGIVATILLTTANSITSQFHVNERLKAFADVYLSLGALEMDFRARVDALADEKEARVLLLTVNKQLAPIQRALAVAYLSLGTPEGVSRLPPSPDTTSPPR